MPQLPDLFTFPTSGWPLYVFACLLVLLLLRILRVADTACSTPQAPTDTPSVTRTRWFWGGKLDKLASTTALSRANTEFFHSKIGEIQARHDLEHLVADLQPPAEAPADREPAATNVTALTLAEIQDLLAVVDMDDQTRADVLRLAAARLAEKRS